MRNRRRRGSDEINLTPLLDVLFTILFIVMLTGMQNEQSYAENAEATQAQMEAVETKVRRVKHAINAFNHATVVPGFDMTIDEMLVYIPQLTEKKRRLSDMANRLPKERVNSGHYGNKSIVEYQYANYDVAAAMADMVRVSDELARAQTALDAVNSSAQLEVDLD